MKESKTLKVMLTCVLAITVLACTVLLVSPKAEAATEGDYTYSVSSGKATITDYSGPGGDITIPATLGSYPVTGIGNSAFYRCESLTSVTIPDSVKSIGDWAFYGCDSLTSVTIPDSVTSIGNSAFSSCSCLTDVYITDPNAWCKISFGDSDANPMYYGDCLHILDDNGNVVTELVLDNTVTAIPSYAFRGSAITAVTIPDSVTSIGWYAFSNCSSLESVTIPDSVNGIGSYAFDGCDSLTYNVYDNAKYLGNANNPYIALITATGDDITTCTIHPDAKVISNEAFHYWESLESVTIPDSVTSIGNSAFSGCTSLESVTIPDSVTSIGAWAFEGCSWLTSVTIGDSVTSIGTGAFYDCSRLTSVTIPDSVTSIGDVAFSGCYRLTYNVYDNAEYLGNANNPYIALITATSYDITTCTIHPDTKIISDEAFYCCESLTSVTIPDSVTSIGDSAFECCTSLESVTIGNGVTSIGDWAFSYCYDLTSVTIGDSVTSIGDYTFYDCTSLTSVVIPDSVISIGDSAFAFSDHYSHLTSVTIGDSVTSIGDSAFECCTSLESVTIPDSVTSIGNYAFSDCDSLVSVTIGNGVTSIGDSAFECCTSLESVTIPDSVTSIGAWAFYDCTSLTSVTIGNSVTSIGDWAFSNCTSLTGIWVDENNANYSSDSHGVLFNKDKTTLIQAPAKGISGSYTIPDSVTSIGDDAFSGCSSLTSVTIPNSVTSIGDYAFDNDKLRIVYYAGTQNRWNAISIGDFNHYLISATIHYNHVHNYDLLPPVIVPPSCTEDGYAEYICAMGSDTYREILPALGHSAGANGVVTPPTCTEQGYTTSACPRCGITVITDYVDALGHNYTGPVGMVAPACTVEGYAGNTCIYCNDVEVKTIIDALGHQMVLVPAVDPTCEKPGLSAGTACQRCSFVGVAQQETAPSLGGNCDFTADPTTCSNCGYVRADVVITNVVLRPSCSGLYFKGSFTFGAHETVSRYGIAVSLYSKLPVADDSNATSLYTVGENSVLISNILGEGKNGRDLIYARPYALLADGTYIYGDVVVTNLKTVVETIDAKFDGLSAAQQTAIADLYQQNTAVMQHWLIPKIKEFA